MITITITITAETIAKLEAAGFNRWTKNGMDRMYINADKLGLEVDRYRSGKAKEGTWQGVEMTKQELQEIDASKIYVDLADGTLHVQTEFVPGYLGNDPTVEFVAEAFVADVLAPEPEPETETEITSDAITEPEQLVFDLDAITEPAVSVADTVADEHLSVEAPTATEHLVTYDGCTCEHVADLAAEDEPPVTEGVVRVLLRDAEDELASMLDPYRAEYLEGYLAGLRVALMAYAC